MKRTALIASLAAAMLAGCASVPPNSGENKADPWETMNRQTYAFNTTVDHYVFRPVAKGYKAVTPKPVRTCVSNMMDNLTEPRNAVNNVLQGKGNGAFVSFMRFIVNSTFGVFGCFDVASMGDLTPHYEDFGQTLGTWGVGNGPYLVLPLLGPSTVRDTVGLGGNYVTSIQSWMIRTGSAGRSGASICSTRGQGSSISMRRLTPRLTRTPRCGTVTSSTARRS